MIFVKNFSVLGRIVSHLARLFDHTANKVSNIKEELLNAYALDIAYWFSII